MRAWRWARMLLHAISAVLILRFAFPRADAARRRRHVQRWAAKLVSIMGLEVRVSGEPPSASARGTMIASNHVSWLDIFVVQGVMPARFIAKSEIRDWPLAGWIAERAGTIFIRREKRRDTARINEHVHAALQEGDCVGLFPEGTTSEGDTLLRFHSSLFEAAVVNAAHVHPCGLRYERPDGSLCRAMAFVGELSFMQSLGLAIRQRGVVARLAFAPAIDTAGLDRREVTRRAETAVATLLGLPPRGTAPRTPSGPPA
jgi:1-acyl-sn-glycerol-3-phosphate acyltransferase